MATFTAEVDVDLEDILDDMTEDEIVKDVNRYLKRKLSSQTILGGSCPQGQGDGDPDYVERAFLAALALPSCPQAIKDLFWHIHGRAM